MLQAAHAPQCGSGGYRFEDGLFGSMAPNTPRFGASRKPRPVHVPQVSQVMLTERDCSGASVFVATVEDDDNIDVGLLEWNDERVTAIRAGQEVIDNRQLPGDGVSNVALSCRYRLLLESGELQVATQLLERLIAGQHRRRSHAFQEPCPEDEEWFATYRSTAARMASSF